jgi:catechol 2,3-dioxygenase-like lactoylglutathione lyase family enzyme
MPLDDNIAFDIIIPTFPVSDVPASVKFYTQKLGFQRGHQEGNYFAHIKRGKAVIALYSLAKLQERAGGDRFTNSTRARATIFCEQISALYLHCVANDITVLDPPQEVPYGWDMQIADADGNILEFVEFNSASG